MFKHDITSRNTFLHKQMPSPWSETMKWKFWIGWMTNTKPITTKCQAKSGFGNSDSTASIFPMARGSFPIPFRFPFRFSNPSSSFSFLLPYIISFFFLTIPPLLFSNHSPFSSFFSPYLLFTHPPPFHFPSTPNLYKTMQRRSTSSVFSRQPSWTQLPRLEKTQLFPLFFLNLS